MKRSPLALKAASTAPSIKRLFVKTSAVGTSKIVRDFYGPNWYKTVNEVQTRDGKKCLDCGCSGAKLDTHHIRPLSKGGTTTKGNLITLCERCHQRRHPHMRYIG